MDRKKLIFGTGVSSSKDYAGLKSVVQAALDSGIYSFDTAPSYHTEEILGRVLRETSEERNICRESLFIQTKIDAWQMQESDGNIERYVESALADMQLDYFDSLLIHWPVPEYFDRTWQSFIGLREKGIARKIGICNVRLRHLLKYKELDFPPEVIQIERNPLRTCEAEINFCHQHEMEVQAYSPLCKMNSRLRYSEILKELSEKYGRSRGQIILRWHLDTGVTPCFTSTKPGRIREYAELVDFELSEEDVRRISSLNLDYKMYLESWACPGI